MRRPWLRTRVVPKMFDVAHKNTVTDTYIAKVTSRTEWQQCLVCGKSRREKKYLRREALMVNEEYLHSVRETVYCEIEKTRRMPVLVTNETAGCELSVGKKEHRCIPVAFCFQ